MKRIISIICLCLCAWGVHAQSTRKIRELEKQHVELQKQIAESESLLQSTKKDVSSQLNNLALLSGQIEERKKYLAAVERDVQVIQREIGRVQAELKKLQAELAEKKKRYEKSVNYMYRNKSVQEKLMFIFSADNLSQIYRRLRYVREYADYQRLQAAQLVRKQEQVQEKQRTLQESQRAKEEMLKQGENERKKLEAQEKERKDLLASLQMKQWTIQAEIKKKRQSAERLNAQIDRLIEIEIEQARKREEEARKREAAERKKAGQSRKEEGKPAQPAPKGQVDRFRGGAESRRLSGVFEQNKGRLPVPITGPYVLVGRYGQYQVLRNVRLDNKGIDLKGKPGAQARAIFDGEVSAIFQYNGLANVLVRHGSYISVYCNLSSVLIKKGSILKTGDVIGQVNTDKAGDTVLHFQLRKETAKLNPEVWLNL